MAFSFGNKFRSFENAERYGRYEKPLEGGIKELRKGSKATSASSEETYQSLNKYAKNFNELARKEN
jgi:ATP-dependent Clp protease ATP-binding subunit ClpA